MEYETINLIHVTGWEREGKVWARGDTLVTRKMADSIED